MTWDSTDKRPHCVRPWLTSWHHSSSWAKLDGVYIYRIVKRLNDIMDHVIWEFQKYRWRKYGDIVNNGYGVTRWHHRNIWTWMCNTRTRSTSTLRSSSSPRSLWLALSRLAAFDRAASNWLSVSASLAFSLRFSSSSSSDRTPPSPLSHFCFHVAASLLAFWTRRWRSDRPLCSSSNWSRSWSNSA